MPILQLVSKGRPVIGYDVNEKLVDKKKFHKYENLHTVFLHVCIPFSDKFVDATTSLSKRFNPDVVILHSTISPGTTFKLQSKLSIPVIYSATRGVHKRMLHDMKRYAKFFAIEQNAPRKEWASSEYVKLMKKVGVQTKKMSSPMTLEWQKL